MSPTKTTVPCTERADISAQQDIVYTMAHLFRTKKYADVIFVVQNHQISAHKAIVAPQCKALEESILKAEKVFKVPKPKVTLANEDYDTIQALLSFLYTRSYNAQPPPHGSLSDSLIFHIKMYDMGLKYVLPNLQGYAEASFAEILSDDSIEMRFVFGAARIIYAEDHGLRRALVEAIARRRSILLRSADEREAFATIPRLASDVVKLQADFCLESGKEARRKDSL